MSKDASSRGAIHSRLREAGYHIVQFDRKLDDISNLRPDVLGFAANAEGELVPWLVVEVKNGSVKPELALPQLVRARELLGTTEHYAVINDQWFRADRSLRSLVHVEGPESPTYGHDGSLADVSLATSLLMDQVWREADRRRGGGETGFYFPPAELFKGGDPPGVETTAGDFVPVRPDVLWTARRRALAAFSERAGHAGEFANQPVLANAIAGLLGTRLRGTVLDPFCGIGNFLWSAMDRALELDATAEFFGVEINHQVGEVASQIARSAPMPATVTIGDSFLARLPEADAVVSAPPFGLRPVEHWTLLDGQQARDFEAAAVDLCVRRLRPGGRAVLLLPTGFTFRRTSEAYRRFLASEFRVGALIGLPVTAIEGTSIRSVILAIDRADPGTTFVAQLGDDWLTQLSEGGAALSAARGHLDAPSGRVA